MLTTSYDSYTSTSSPPTIIYHLVSTLILFVPAMLLSGELLSIYHSGHFGFFTEIGFWFQEIVMALCGLANLLSFWNLVKVGLHEISGRLATF